MAGFFVFHGAEGETRTLTPRRQNLNLVRLPISPLPLRGLGFHHLTLRQRQPGNDGVADGARTHDNRNHNPGLYQLSYSHHCLVVISLCRMARPTGFEPVTHGLEGRTRQIIYINFK